MSCYSKKELEDMLMNVVDELELSDSALEEHGPMGTPPAELVRLVLDQKDRQISLLKRGFVEIEQVSCTCAANQGGPCSACMEEKYNL